MLGLTVENVHTSRTKCCLVMDLIHFWDGNYTTGTDTNAITYLEIREAVTDKYIYCQEKYFSFLSRFKHAIRFVIDLFGD